MGVDISEVQPGCPTLIVWFIMPALSVVVATLALIYGATYTFECHRVEQRQIEAASETRGDITVPVQRVAQAGRTDVTIIRRLLGLFPIRHITLPDVVEAEGSSETASVRDRSTRETSRYQSGQIKFTTRGGEVWEAWGISHAFGASPVEVGERVKAFIEADAPDMLRLRIVPWLANVIGVPFAFLVLMFVRLWIRRLRGLPVGRARASQTG